MIEKMPDKREEILKHSQHGESYKKQRHIVSVFPILDTGSVLKTRESDPSFKF